MADNPTGGIYPPWLAVPRVAGGRLRVSGRPFGPAGASIVELPDGSSWEVDHADPSTLVAIDVPLTDDDLPPLLLAAYGEERAVALLEAAASAPDTDEGDDVPDPGTYLSLPQLVPSQAAAEAGGLVQLVDLADDPTIAPLARIAAAAQAVSQVEFTPGGDLIAQLVPMLIDRAAELTVDVSHDVLPHNSKDAYTVESALRSLRAAAGTPRVEFEDLTERIGLGIGRRHLDARPGPRRRRAIDAFARPEHAGDATEAVRTEWISSSLVRVTAPSSMEERWVRALHVRGLTMIALVPMQQLGDTDVAEFVVPPILERDDLRVQIVDRTELPIEPERPIERLRLAIETGRIAASDERAGHGIRAAQHWSDCAQLWEELDDHHRAGEARSRAGRATSGSSRRGWLADDLDPYEQDRR
ncbi:MAG: hypothetical protein ACOYOQ_15615 [Microthrixaceae bacterium]